MLEVISFIIDRRHDRDENTQHPRDWSGTQRDTRRIVSTAAAATTLPHSKRCDTRMTSGQGNQSNG
jgi:hypothetical protein